MYTAVGDLLEYSRLNISESHIADFVLSDPGYFDYVKAWSEIWYTGKVPKRCHFDLSEVIGVTVLSHKKKGRDSARFIHFRQFVNAVALNLLHLGNSSDGVVAPNYLALSLLLDCDFDQPEQDRYTSLTCDIFLPTRDMLKKTGVEEEYPFFTFAGLIASDYLGDHQQAAKLACMLIEDESDARRYVLGGTSETHPFLLGLTCFGSAHKKWLAMASQLKNPFENVDLQLVMEALN